MDFKLSSNSSISIFVKEKYLLMSFVNLFLKKEGMN